MPPKSTRTVHRHKIAPIQSPAVTAPLVPVVGREQERAEIRDFLEKYVLPSGSGTGSTLYVSGCPGTGKTLSVLSTVAEFTTTHGPDSFAFVSVNAMSIGNAIGIFDALAGQLAQQPVARVSRRGGAKRKRELAEFCTQVQDGVEKVVSVLRTCEKPVLALVDEVDRLVPSLAASKNRGKRKANVLEVELLTALLRLPFIVPSDVRISIIGIANSMDLALNLESFYGRKCVSQALAFKPYTADQLRAIVQATFERQAMEASVGAEASSTIRKPRTMEASAVELCVRKIASLHGDCRKVMDVCRQALSVEKTGDTAQTVTIGETAKLLDECYRGAFDSEAALKSLPLQQLLVLASACKIAINETENDEWPIHVLRSAVLDTAHQLKLPSSHTAASTSSLIDQAVFLSQCGLLALKDAGKGRLGSWKLQIPPAALKHTLSSTNSLIANALATNDQFI